MTLPVRMMTNSVRERFISSQFTGVRNCNKKLQLKWFLSFCWRHFQLRIWHQKHANAGFHTPTKNIKMPQFLIFYTRLKKLTCGACDKYPVCLWKWVENPDYIRTRARLCKLCTQCVSGSIDFSTNSVIGEKPIYRFWNWGWFLPICSDLFQCKAQCKAMIQNQFTISFCTEM